MYFKNIDHKDRFRLLIAKAGQGNDCEYTAALYVLAAISKDVDKYVQEGGGIKFPLLFREGWAWSSSEKALIKLAAALFNSDTWEYTLDDVFYSLDEENVRVALQALEMRHLAR